MFKKRVTFKILLLLIASDLFETAIHFFFKKSVLAQNGFKVVDLAGAAVFFKGVSLSPFLWLGLLMVAIVFIIWSSVLSKIDLSVAVPIASFSYLLVPAASIIFLHEKIAVLSWIGIFFILAGVILVSLSSKEKIAEEK